MRFLLIAALLCAALPAMAQDDEGWRLEGSRQRYGMDLQAPPPQITGGAVEIPTTFTVGAETFPDRRVPAFPIAGPGDVVWRAILALPTGELADKREVPLEERYTVKGGSLRGSGKQILKRRGRKLILKTDLELTVDVQGPLQGQKAALTMRTTFDLKLGRLLGSSFELVANVVVAGQPGKLRWAGEVTPGEAFEVGKASFPVKVEKAIEKGRQWLLRTTRSTLATYRGQAGGQRLGRIALACFALLRSGVSPVDLKQEFQWMASQPLEETYSVALWVMALEALTITRERRQPRAGLRSVARYERGDVPARSKELIAKAVAWLDGARKKGSWTYGSLNKEGETRAGDRSNAQFAVLALHSAMACGVEVPPQLWKDVLAELLGAQESSGPGGSLAGSVFAAGSPFAGGEEDGAASADAGGGGTRVRPGGATEARAETQRGWAYGVGGRGRPGIAYGSMTAAGVSSLAIAREALDAQSGGTQDASLRGSLDALRDGLAWLAENFDVTTNPKRDGNTHYYYWLYSLEKAMDTSGVERLAKHEWWQEAATELLTRQKPAGDWEGDLKDTALALIVLNRATLPAKLEVEEVRRRATGEGSAAEWDKVVVEGTGRLGLRQLLGSMADSPKVAATRLKLAQEAFGLLGEEHQPRLIPRLRPLLDSPHKPTRKWVSKTCKDLAGSDEPGQLEVFGVAFDGLRQAGERKDPADIPQVRKALVLGGNAPALRKQALTVLCRLRAVEALPDVIDALDHREVEARAFAWACLVTLAGAERRPFDPKAAARQRAEQAEEWRAWFQEEGAGLVAVEQQRRALRDLAHEGRAERANAVFRAAGEAGWPLLIDALQEEASRARAHRLLRELTGGNLPADQPDAWRKWLRDGRPKLPEAVASSSGAKPKPKPIDLFAEDEDEDDEVAAPDEDTPDEPEPAPPAREAGESKPLRARWRLVPRPSERD